MESATQPQAESEIVWLSGEILFFLNKILFPALWVVLVAGIPLWVLVARGRLSLAPPLQLFALMVLAVSVFVFWFAIHVQRVGYRDQMLIVANYQREAAIRFKEIATVGKVWWGKDQVVRIEFYAPTAFGSVVYYIPKWAPLRAFGSPEEDLKRVIE